MADTEYRSYRAKSAWSDPIVIIQAVSLALLNQDVRAVIPPAWLPAVAALLAIITIVLQVTPRVADNPVRLNVAPGDSKPVDVRKLE